MDELQKQIDKLRNDLQAFTRGDRFQLDKDVYVGMKKRLVGAIYSGTPTNLPVGWTYTANATDDYTITHNLDTTDYAVVITPISSNAGFTANVTMAANSFRVFTFTGSAGTSFCFTLQLT